MNPTDQAQRSYLERRREVLATGQPEVIQAALAARALIEGLPRRRLCPHEVARLERRALEAERQSMMLSRAIAALDAELAVHHER